MTLQRYTLLALSLAFLAAGCSDSSGRVAGVDKTTVRGPSGQKLTLVKPAGVTIQRGDAETVTIQLRRENLHEDVRVTIDDLPKGVEAVDAPRSTNGDSINLVLRASDQADLVKNHQAQVTAEGPHGMRATEPIEINVLQRS